MLYRDAMRNYCDELAKQIGEAALGACGATATQAEDAHVRSVAGPILLQFKNILERKPEREPQEQELLMAMHDFWKEARMEGRQEGRQEGRLDTLRKQLALKFGELGPEIEARLSSAQPEDIDRFLERVLFADTLASVFA